MRARPALSCAAVLAALSLVGAVAPGLATAARAAGTPQPAVVSAAPQAGTPNLYDGAVLAAAEVGGTMVVGGTFTRRYDGPVASGTPVVAAKHVLAFDKATGAVRKAFAPVLAGGLPATSVTTLLPGPDGSSVYVGGLFTSVNGATVKGLVLLDLATGARRASFTMPTLDIANVQTVQRSGGRLFVGGGFTRVGGVPHGGIATLDPATGALDPFVSSTVLTNHSWTPSSPSGSAKAPVGVNRIDITADGATMVAIGNFRTVDGVGHDQIATWDLTGSRAALRPWATSAFAPICNAASYDTYVRDVSFSPDGGYFAVSTTGGYSTGASLCDSASRFETGATGPDVQPTWVDATGKDSLLSVAVTGTAVYVGGHQRWLNNAYGADTAGPGAVPRPGVAALDPATGLPLAWNPGRSPRGVGTWLLYATPTGLWVGSDTDTWGSGLSGSPKYTRGKLAFFPLSGGAAPASRSVASLPGQVVLGTSPASPASGVLYRVDAGGPRLRSTDAGPDWAADNTSSSAYRTSGSTAVTYGAPVPYVDSTVPPGTPEAVFAAERYDTGAKGDGKEMQWAFPVPAGRAVDVRLYFANRSSSTQAVGKRTFDVSVDGTVALRSFDIVAAAGTQTGTMRSVPVTSDGSVDIGFTHEVGSPVVSAIEIVPAGTGPFPATAGSLTTRTFDGTSAGPASPLSSPLDPTTVHGATVIGDRLFYGRSAGDRFDLYSRPLKGTGLGAEVKVDPYGDPAWATVETGSGPTYRGTKPSWYSSGTNVTSMAYDGHGRLYYTRYQSTGLYSRTFDPDAGVMGSAETTVTGTALPTTVVGAFLSGSSFYYATGNGNLSVLTLTAAGLTGTPTVVSGPGRDGVDWNSSVLYLTPPPAANAAPTASFTSACDLTSCSFDGSASSDSDGTLASYAWDFGDGRTGSGARPAHTYAAGGTYTVALTVRDDAGATGTRTQQLTVRAAPASPIAFRGSSGAGTSGTSLTVPLPSGVQAGNALVLQVTENGTGSPGAPAGWTEVTRSVFASSSSLTVVWQRVATASDTAAGAGVKVTVPAPVKLLGRVLAYAGTDPGTPVAAAAVAADVPLTTAHTAPGVSVATPGSWVVSLWVDKSSTTTAWTLPSALTRRAAAYGTGTGYLTAVQADEGSGRPTGTSPGRTATTDATSRAVMATLVLAPHA